MNAQPELVPSPSLGPGCEGEDVLSREDQIQLLLDRRDESKKHGQPLSAEELCAECPELLAELKAWIRDLDAFDHFEEATIDGPVAPVSETPVAGIRAGRYRATKLHKVGGLGEVFYAEDEELKREVALKRLRPTVAWSSDARVRFVMEAEVTGRLEHPGIVPVYGLGKDEDERPYYAMRFLRGKTLDQVIAEYHAGQGMSLVKLLGSFQLACQAMAYAHSRDVIHRDIKPSNIMVGDYGEVLVIDWGLAKVGRESISTPDDQPAPEISPPVPTESAEQTAGNHAAPTQRGELKGTPVYMSPEQARCEPAGPASDVYCLGATLYKLLTGQVPYSGASLDEIVEKVKRRDLIAPRAANSSVPPALEAICLKAMSQDPGQRYQTAKELADDVDRWLADQPVTAWQEPWDVRARRWIRKHRTLVTSGLSTMAVALLLLASFTVRLNAEYLKLERALSELNKTKDDLESSYTELKTAQDGLVAKNQELEESVKRETRLRKNAEELLKAGLSQTDNISMVLDEPLLMRPENAPIYDMVLNASQPVIDELAELADGPIKLDVLCRRDVFRLNAANRVGLMEPDQLTEARQNLLSYLQINGSDAWAEFHLGLIYHLEARWHALRGEPFSESVDRACELFMKHAAPDTQFGRQSMRNAAQALSTRATVITTANDSPQETNAQEHERAQELALQLQSLIDAYSRGDKALLLGTIPQRSMLLTSLAIVQLRRLSPEQSLQSSQAALEILDQAPPEAKTDSMYFRARFLARMIFADCRQNALSELEHWTQISLAADDMTTCAEMNYPPQEVDRQAILRGEYYVTGVGVQLAEKFALEPQKDRAAIQRIVERVKLALERLEQQQRRVDEAYREPNWEAEYAKMRFRLIQLLND